MSQDPNAETSTETWQVAIGPNNVREMSLEQLDAAYQQGTITEQTLIWTEGMDQWAPLSEVIGGEEEPAAPVAAPVATQPSAAAAFAPGVAAPAPRPAVAGPSVIPHPMQVVQGPPATQTLQSFPPAQAVQSFPPAQAVQSFPPAQAVQSFPPAQAAFAPAASVAPMGVGGVPQAFPSAPVSTAPVAMSLDGLDVGEFSPKGGKKKIGLLLAAAVALGAGGIAMVSAGGGGEVSAPSAAAAPIAAGDQPLAIKTDDAPLDTSGGYKVSEAEEKAFAKQEEQANEMREKMSAAMAGEEKKEAAPKPSKVNKASWNKNANAKKTKGGSGELKAGGSAYDPLNSSLP